MTEKLSPTSTPDEHRRFELASPYDEVSGGRSLAAQRTSLLRNYLVDLDNYGIDIVAATVFGSSVKGRCRRGSDLDCFIYTRTMVTGMLGVSWLFNMDDGFTSHVRRTEGDDRFTGLNVFSITEQNLLDKIDTCVKNPENLRLEPNVIDYISGLFLPSIGPFEIKRLRSHVVESIEKSSKGMELTRRIARMLETTEELNRGASIDYPQDVYGFRRMYQLI
ncbi:MAG: nucleotidyltransferase domain-containing protein [Patescibacteria group bacterium]